MFKDINSIKIIQNVNFTRKENLISKEKPIVLVNKKMIQIYQV